MESSAAEELPELAYLVPFYRQTLTALESIPFAGMTSVELHPLGEQMAALKKFINDCIEEGYEELREQVDTPLAARQRLDRLLAQVIQQLQPEATERQLFYLYADPVVVEGSDEPRFEGAVLPLETLLAELSAVAEGDLVDITACFETVAAQLRWQQQVERLAAEMVAYTGWSYRYWQRHAATATPLFLLRDSLFLYLGYRWLHQQGYCATPPQPLFLSRKWIEQIDGHQESYESLFQLLYAALQQPLTNRSDLQRYIRDHFNQVTLSSALQQAIAQQLERLAAGAPILLIESGCHATLPLLIQPLYRGESDFILYATVPWLAELYRDCCYQPNYTYLRDIETSLLQNALFQLKTVAGDQLWVQKTASERLEKLAQYELQVFMRQLKAHAHEFGGVAFVHSDSDHPRRA